MGDTKKRKHSIQEGVLPWAFDKDTNEFMIGRGMTTIGRKVKKVAGHIYPGAREPQKRKKK